MTRVNRSASKIPSKKGRRLRPRESSDKDAFNVWRGLPWGDEQSADRPRRKGGTPKGPVTGVRVLSSFTLVGKEWEELREGDRERIDLGAIRGANRNEGERVREDWTRRTLRERGGMTLLEDR